MKKLLSIFAILLLLLIPTTSVFASDGVLPEGYSLVYRLYHPGTGEHLYTGDANENEVLGELGWNQEGAVFISHANANEEAAVYRLRHPKSKEHLYTTDTNEINVLCDTQGWESDNNGAPIFYGSTPSEGLDSDQADRVGNYVYRLYNPKTGLHLLSNDHLELLMLTQQGWTTDNFFGSPQMFYAIYPDMIQEAGIIN